MGGAPLDPNTHGLKKQVIGPSPTQHRTVNQKEETAIDTPIPKDEDRQHCSHWTTGVLKARQAQVIGAVEAEKVP